MRIAFVVGSVDISGGTYVIFQHAAALAASGHDVSLLVLLPIEPHMLDWHPAARSLTIMPIEAIGAREFDLVVATWWRTALVLHRVKASRYAYFVQSIESRFVPEEQTALRALIDSTYGLGLPGITEASWIQRYLSEHHGADYQLVPNGIRKDIYTVDGPAHVAREDGTGLRFLVEGALGVPFKNVGRTLKILRRSRLGETWLLTPSAIARIPGVARVYSRVAITETPPIYRSCDVIVKLSYVEGMFGPPLEMFHCGGTAIVYAVTGHDEYIVHGKNALVLAPGDEESVVAALRRLERDRGLLAELKAGAIRTAEEWPSWEASSILFERALDPVLSARPVERDEIEGRNEAASKAYEERLRAGGTPSLSARVLTSAHTQLDRLPERWRKPIRNLGYIMETR